MRHNLKMKTWPQGQKLWYLLKGRTVKKQMTKVQLHVQELYLGITKENDFVLEDLVFRLGVPRLEMSIRG